VQFQLVSDSNSESLKCEIVELRAELRGKNATCSLQIRNDNFILAKIYIKNHPAGFQVETIEQLEQIKSEFQDSRRKRLLLQVIGSTTNTTDNVPAVPALPIKCQEKLVNMKSWLEKGGNFSVLVRRLMTDLQLSWLMNILHKTTVLSQYFNLLIR
jgi:hypothetical protein